MTSYKDKNIYQINETNFVEVEVIGYTWHQGKTTYRVIYDGNPIDVPEDKLMTKYEWLEL